MNKTSALVSTMALLVLMTAIPVYAQEEKATADNTMWLVMGAALSIGICAIAAGYGIARAGAAAMGAIAEKPEAATWGLIIVALAEGIALYGLIIAFLIVAKI